MKDFIKAILLVSAFFFLLLFSIPYLSSGKNDVTKIPFIQKTFQTINISVDWLSGQKFNSIDFFWFKKDYADDIKDDIENLLPSDAESWAEFKK
jgi:hypothetical protein